MNVAYLLIGGNLGNRKDYLNQAISKINAECGSIRKLSAVYESEPWGDIDQPKYLNQALELHTAYDAHSLLNLTKSIENALGRTRERLYASRTIDIDILYFNELIIQDSTLTIPHPRIAERHFALAPMNEIANIHFDPVVKMTIQEMLSLCKDPLKVYIHE